MAKIFDLAAFKSPKFSVFDLSHSNVLSYPIGKVIPIGYIDMSANDRARISVSQLTRFAAMLAPSFDDYEIAIDGHFIPYRLIPDFTEDASASLYLSDQPSEKFFNFTENADNLKTIKTFDWSQIYRACVQKTGRIEGSLYDYLGYPTMSRFREMVRKIVNLQIGTASYSFASLPSSVSEFDEMADFFSTGVYMYVPGFVSSSDNSSASWVLTNTPPSVLLLPKGTLLNFSSFGESPSFGESETLSGYTFYGWLTGRVLGSDAVDYNSWDQNFYGDAIDRFISSNNLRMDSLFEEYLDWLTMQLIFDGVVRGDDDDPFASVQTLFFEKDFNLLPLKCYWRAIADWYANTNLDGDSESVYSAHCGQANNVMDIDFEPWSRRWASDYFTSAFDSPQVGQAQRIPVNGTIPDLRANNRLQQIFERAKYAGRRYIEQVRAFFGAESSNARYDRTEVLFREKFRVSPEAVTQTSQETLSATNSPLGSLAGNAVAVSHHTCCDYTCEEHGMLMVMVSVRPHATYMQGVNKFLSKSKMTDFLIPQFSNLGEQEINQSEIYMDVVGVGQDNVNNDGVLGYQRRYAEYMFMPNEVHSSMRTSLDFWHSAREFEGIPALKDLIEVDAERDGLNRVFAVQSRENIYSKFWFDIQVVRPLPRMIDYSL